VPWQSVDAWLDRVPLRRRVAELARSSDLQIYLVGGTVRDALLGRESCDLDLAVDGSAIALARTLADALRGALVPLDPQRDVARVVCRLDGMRLNVDLAGLRAPTISGDLRLRDFTVNAMALPLADGWGELLDPTGGRADLEARLLRAVSEGAFRDDPLRMLRAVRLRAVLEFGVEAATERLIRRDAPLLRGVSPERIRDELHQILALDASAAELDYARDLGLLDVIQSDLQGGLPVLWRLESLQRACAAGEIPAGVGCPERLAEVWAYGAELERHWGVELSGGRQLRTTVKLAALLSRVADPSEAAQELRLSSREVEHIGRAVAAARFLNAEAQHSVTDAVGVYRYYRRFGAAGVDGAVLAPLLRQAAPACDLSWKSAGALLEGWFRKYRLLVSPPRLVNGHDVLTLTDGRGGPHVGAVLEAVREAQVAGLVCTREEALSLAAARVRQGPRHPGYAG